MKTLEQIISTFDEEKCVTFEKLLIEKGKNNKGTDYNIFNSIRNTLDFEITNNNAYHSSRKRLVKKLIDFIHVDEIQNTDSDRSIIDSYLTFSKYLNFHNADKTAWKYLMLAEKLAEKEKLYLEINKIYLVQIELSNSEYSPEIDSIIEKYQNNKKLQQLEEKLTIGTKIIETELNKIKLRGESDQFENVLTKVQKQLMLKDEDLLNPKFAYHFLTISRNAAKGQKSYHQFTPFALKTYDKLIKQNSFQSTDIYYQLSILYMICHTLLRTRNFNELSKFIPEFESILNTSNTTLKKVFEARLTLINASYKALTGNIKLAIEITEKEYENFNSLDNVAKYLNLGLYHFMNNDLSGALKTNHKFGHSEKWLEKKLGLEWVMKKQLMEIIIHFDLENFDLCESLIRSFEYRFKKLFNIEKYNTLKSYIRFIKSQLKYEKIDIEAVSSSLVIKPKEEEDLQAMMFYCWIKSKLKKQVFYDTILETINPNLKLKS